LKRSLAIAEKALGPEHPDIAHTLNQLATLYLDDGRLDEALSASTRVIDIMMKHLSISSAQRSGSAMDERRLERVHFSNYIVIADAAARKSPKRRPETRAETFRVAQMAQASSPGAAVAALAARLAAGGGTRAVMIRERQDLVQQWQGLDGALIKAVSRSTAERRRAEEASLRATLEDVTQRLDGLDARIAAEFPDYTELSNPTPLPVEAAQALLASDEALLVYLVVGKGTWL
jgi:hypothetical protein